MQHITIDNSFLVLFYMYSFYETNLSKSLNIWVYIYKNVFLHIKIYQ